MAKKRKDMPAEIVLEEPLQARLYSQSTWSGITKFDCALCAFDAFSEAEIRAHLQQYHQQLLEPRQQHEPSPSILVADKRGRVVNAPDEGTKTLAIFEISEEEARKWLEQP
jgi:hypothetical protein